MARIEGLDKLTAKLKARIKQAQADVGAEVNVGYTAAYALFVHEMIQGAPHPPQSDAQRKAMWASIKEREARGHKSWAVGGPKFLERPFRELRKTLGEIIRKALKGGASLRNALLLAGLRLQRESQEVCPVDTGALRASAFTRIVG